MGELAKMSKRLFLYFEYLTMSLINGKTLTMNAVHQQETESSLSYGLGKNGQINFADMDKFQWYAINDNVMGGVSNGTVSKSSDGSLHFLGNYQKKIVADLLLAEPKCKAAF